jgi:antirestriction protein ArdC
VAGGPDVSQAKQLASEALDRLIEAVEAGHSRQLTDYLAMLGRFHQYSLANVLLIALQSPGATHVAGYRTWQSFGRQVRRGESSIRILAPIVRRTGDDDQEEEERVVAFRTVGVFDVSQTSGEPLPQFARAKGSPGKYTDRLRESIRSRGIALQYSDDIAPALGISSGGQITVRCGLAPAAEFSVLVHELAHEMLHRGGEALNRTVRETEAEAVAFVVNQAIGLESGTASSDYIQLYRGKKETLIESLGRIQQTAAQIICGISPSDSRQAHGERLRASSRAQEEALHDR